MNENATTGLQNSGTEPKLQQVLSHLHIQSLGEPTCQACKEPLTEGDQVTLYLYKPTGSSTYSVGQCRCRNHDDDLPTLFTLGVTELVVDGRVGQCRDHATQQTWPVLISPTVRLKSGRDTTTGRVPTDRPANDQSGHTEWQYGEAVSEQVATRSSAEDPPHRCSDEQSTHSDRPSMESQQ